MYGNERAAGLKRQALLFDRFALWGPNWSRIAEQTRADLDFLLSANVVYEVDLAKVVSSIKSIPTGRNLGVLASLYDLKGGQPSFTLTGNPGDWPARDLFTRFIAEWIPKKDAEAFIPVCEGSFYGAYERQTAEDTQQEVIEVALTEFPVPDETRCSWPDILEFRQESHDKKWTFNRFLRTLASTKQTPAEIRDDIEWTINEYSKAMQVHGLKSSSGLIEAYFLPALEVIEGFPIPKISSVLKAGVSIRKRKVELLESEMKAPGRECAYVFDARKKFGRSQ